MTNDFMIEIFAYDVCVKIFARSGQYLPTATEIYQDECCKVKNYTETFHYMFYEAVICRSIFLTSMYCRIITKEILQSLKSLSDCFDYVIQILDRNDLFDQLPVFERLISTLSFVASLSLLLHHENEDIDILNNGHMLWVMYFEKFTETFYAEGGWKELKRVVSSYYAVCPFVNFFMTYYNNIGAVLEALVNYERFQSSPKFHQCKCVSKQWVKFSINNFERYLIISIHSGLCMNLQGVHLILENLKLMCDPHSKISNEVFRRFMTFTSDDEIKPNVNDNLAIEHNFPEQKDINSDVSFYGFSQDTRDFENMSRIECNFIDSKVPLNLIENSINSNSSKENNARKTASVLSSNHNFDSISVETTKVHLETEIENLSEKKNLDSDKSSENISVNTQKKEFKTKNLSFESIHPEDDTIGEVNLSKMNDKAAINNVPLMCLKPINEIENITDITTHVGKDIDHVERTTKTSPVHQFAVDKKTENDSLKTIFSSNSFKAKIECENTTHETTEISNDDKKTENTSLKTIFSSNSFKAKNECENTTHETTEISNNDNLLKENDGFAMINLHRMLLVLGDRQGIEYVLSTLPNSTGMQANVTKRKKRGKKKKQSVN